jgi:hypothetical protein
MTAPATQSDYATLRQGGAPPNSARAQLSIPAHRAARLEAHFRAQAARGMGDVEQPRFARHERHVAAVMAQGGFPALTERRCGRDGMRVCLPLIWPRPAADARTGKR